MTDFYYIDTSFVVRHICRHHLVKFGANIQPDDYTQKKQRMT